MPMQRAYFQKRRARIEIIPMIDIMMFLLIFFIMITLKMIAGATLKIELPRARTAASLPDTRVVIAVQADGVAAINGTRMNRRDLLAALARIRSSSRSVEAVLALDKDASAELLVDAMNLAREAGVSAFAVTARPGEPDVEKR